MTTSLINWEKFRSRKTSLLEETLLKLLFQEYCYNNSFFNGLSSPEVVSHYDTFRSSWMIMSFFLEMDSLKIEVK